jgi:hypothetical protein
MFQAMILNVFYPPFLAHKHKQYIFLLVCTNKNLSIQFCLTYFYTITVLAMKTKVMYDVVLKDGGKLCYPTPKNMNPNCPLHVHSVYNKIKHLKLLDSEIKSDIYKQLTWKPQILDTCYFFITHTHTHICTYTHTLIFFAYSMSVFKTNKQQLRNNSVSTEQL